MSTPLISIIIPAYNYARFVGFCIESVIAQTYENWELIVIDNGSTDNTSEVLDRYNDPRIRRTKIEINDGPVKAWAMGYDMSRGEYIALLPADDMYTPRKLEKQVEYLNSHPGINCIGTYISVVDDSGKPTKEEHWMEGWINREVDYTDLKQWRWKHHFCIPTALYQKSLCDVAGKVPLDGLTSICDWDFHIRLLGANAQFHVIPEKLTRYRWHQSNTSHSSRAHNQWVYSHLRSMVPVLRRLAENPLQEIKECIEALYLDTQPNYFIEDVPENWRCAHLEALMNPEGGLAQFSHYHEFKAYTEAWTMNSENRAAIAALDNSLMNLRERLLKPRTSSAGEHFPLEQARSLFGKSSRGSIAVRVGRELRRGYVKFRKHMSGRESFVR